MNTTFSVNVGSYWSDFKFGVQNGVCRNGFDSWKGERNTTFSVHIESHWPDFKLGVQNGFFFRIGILLLAATGSGTLHFLCILAHTCPILNLG